MRYRVVLLLAVVMVVGIALGGMYMHSRRQLLHLQKQAAYASPKEGMREIVAESYIGLQKVEIAYAGREPPFLDNLYFVEARVWADRRADGKAMKAEGDNPGCFFLRLENGWVMVPESRWPWVVALGMRLFG